MLIDPLCDPPSATVFASLKDGRYTSATTVELGEELHIPEPVDFTLETAVFLEED